MIPERGNIVLVPKGTVVWLQPRYGGTRKTVSRRDHIAVVEWTRDVGRPAVGWTVGGLDREADTESVELLDAGNHTLSVGKRRILGGSPIRGMGNIYATNGHCACGDEYIKRPDANDVRRMHREHVLRLGERAMVKA